MHKDNTVLELLTIILKKIPAYGRDSDELFEKSKIIVNNKIVDEQAYLGQICKSSIVECAVLVDFETRSAHTSSQSDSKGEQISKFSSLAQEPLKIDSFKFKSTNQNSIFGPQKNHKNHSEKLNLKKMSVIGTIDENQADNYDCEVNTDSGSEFVPEIERFNGDSRFSNFKPILTKEFYFTEPPIETLRQMTFEELKRVKNFKVQNKYGCIEWIGFTDLTEVNLDTTVHIKHNSAEVYPEDSFGSTKPSEG